VTGRVFEEVAQNVAQPFFFVKKYAAGTVKTSCTKILRHFCNFQNTVQSTQSPNVRKLAQSGIDVMITIFCDF
jgi:hypothetical protein